MKVSTGSRMAEIDERTINGLGIPGAVLMENAARALCRIFEETVAPEKPATLVLCGSGNNGGDGFCAARILHGWGYPVKIIHTGRCQTMKEDARLNYRLAEKSDIPIIQVCEDEHLPRLEKALEEASWIIDAVFGTGLTRPVVGTVKKILEIVSSSGKKSIACDIPSGIDSDTGRQMGAVIPAEATVTFGLPKWGHFLCQGPRFCGRIVVADIGFPPSELNSDEITGEIITASMVNKLIPSRPFDSHKSSFGRLAIAGGSKNLLGAAILCAKASMKAGCGYVTLFVPNILESAVKSSFPDVVTEGLPDIAGGFFKIEATDILLKRMETCSALVIGPGMGTWESTRSVIIDVLEEGKVPAVIDADALNAIKAHGDVRHNPEIPWIMTPHAGEASRLLDKTVEDVLEDPLGSLKTLVERYNAVVMLKGPNTLVMNTDGRVYVNLTGNPVLSVMGSGDLLSGIAGALLARGIPAFEAAAGAAYIHGLMGDLAARELYGEGVLPTELIPLIPEAMERIRSCAVKERFEIIR